MAIVSLSNSETPTSTAEYTLFEAGPDADVPIVKFVAHNDTGAASTYYAKIYSASGTPKSVQPVRTVNRYSAHVPQSVVGCVIPKNGRLVVGVGSGNSISFTVSGEV